MIETEWIKEISIKKMHEMGLNPYNVRCTIDTTNYVIFECDVLNEYMEEEHIKDSISIMEVMLAQAVYNMKDANPYK